MSTSSNAEGETIPLEEFLETVTYHNRDYQQYAIENGAYFAPIDEDEIQRLRDQYEALQTLFDGRLIFPNYRSPRRVLDCGFGTGGWAVDVVQNYPNIQVDGVDIYPYWLVTDFELPPRFNPMIDDLNQEFSWPRGTFDIVHSQMMVEVYFNAQSDNGTLTDGHALRRWSSLYIQAMSRYKDPRAGMRLRDWMEHAGFVAIEQRQMQLPMNAWPQETRARNCGDANRNNVQQLLSSMAVYPFTQILGMDLQDVHLLVAQARREADNPAFRPYFPLYICIGQKRR